MESKAELTGMGATIAGVLIGDNSSIAFNVGDARVYLWSDGYLMLLSTDDRLAGTTNVVTQSMGGADRIKEIAPHLHEFVLEEGQVIVICSDGLSETVEFSAMQDAVGHLPVDAAAGRLLDLALDAGAPDNVSLIVLEREGD